MYPSVEPFPTFGKFFSEQDKFVGKELILAFYECPEGNMKEELRAVILSKRDYFYRNRNTFYK